MEQSRQRMINSTVLKMYCWLDSWCQKSGAYNSFVVHRYDLKRLKMIHETPWGQGAIIEGLITLYQKKKSSSLKRDIEKSVDLQISRLDRDGSFINAGFEDDRFSSLVHNAMADRSLLAYYNCSGLSGKNKFKALQTVEKNVNDYLIGTLWSQDVGAFKFSKIDYYSPNTIRYVANMNCVAIEVLLELYNITQKDVYLEYAKKCGEWIKTQSISSDNKYIDGGISYGSTNPQNLVSIYTGLCLPGLCRLYNQFNDEAYKYMAIKAANNLVSYTCDGYFCHSMEGEKELRYPYFLAGAGIILYGIQEVNECFGLDIKTEVYLDNILKKQYKNGSIPNFMHYNSGSNNRMGANSKMEVWEDIVPCLPWNAQLFRYLAKQSTGLLKEKWKLKPLIKLSSKYIYYESLSKCIIISWFPLKSVVFIIINKKKDVSYISFSLIELVRKIKKIRNKRK